MPYPITGTVTTKDGVKIPWYEQGHGKTIFIFNGFSCNQHNLKLLVRELSKDFRVISFDYRGHGNAGMPSSYDNVGIAEMVGDGLAVWEELKLKKANVIGYSMGAQVMLEFARLYPEKTEKLVSINGIFGNVFDTFLRSNIGAPLIKALKSSMPLTSDLLNPLWRFLMGVPFDVKFALGKLVFLDAAKADPEDIRPFLEQLKELDVRLLLILASNIHEHSAYEFMDKIDKKALFIAGNRDLFAPHELSERAASLVKNGSVYILEGGTHNSNLEHADTISAQIKEFLK